MTNNIFLSYSDSDKEIAIQLREALQNLLPDDVWMREFDLNGGSLIVEEIGNAMDGAKWLVVLLSKKAYDSHWLKFELDSATYRAIEDLGVRLLLVKLDDSAFPKHLEVTLKNQLSVNLDGITDYYPEFFKIAEYIGSESDPPGKNQVYVNRGESGDHFSLLARRNRIVFVLGWAGIGKSSFIQQTVAEKLRKAPLTIGLTHGSSLDFLARQLLRRTHVDQPLNADSHTDEELLGKAIEAVKLRSSRFFVFVDNAELALDGSNELLPVLERFLDAFIGSNINTHVVLATTRTPNYSPRIAEHTDLMKLTHLSPPYIKESIDLWLEHEPEYKALVTQPGFDEVSALTGGHPLAAKLLASYLKVKPATDLLAKPEKQLFELKLARHILQTSDHAILTELEKLILFIMAVVQDPMTFEDLLSSKDLKKHKVEEIRQAKIRLNGSFLIEQDGEFLRLHAFLVTYFRDQFAVNEALYDRVARDIGLSHFEKVAELNAELSDILFHGGEIDGNEDVTRLSNELFRYAIPAERLLLSVGEETKAAALPLHVKGTLREMVFYFYQEKRNFNKALYFANQWLEISPDDSDILLYQARCYRNFRDKGSKKKAEMILNRLDQPGISKFFATRIYSERGALARGDEKLDVAKEYYESGIKLDREYPYVGNYVGLAHVLLDEAKKLDTDDYRRTGLIKQAVGHLKKAKTLDIPVFERFHIGFYIEVLLEAGDYDQAEQLIDDALRDRPDDSRLNYAMGEILRKHGQLDAAENFARKAFKAGVQKAALSLANIVYEQGIKELTERRVNTAKKKFEEALGALETFRPEYGDDEEVAAGTKSKVFRAMQEYPKARDALERFSQSTRVYTVYEHCRVDYSEALQLEKMGNKPRASILLRNAKSRIDELRKANGQLGAELSALAEDIEKLRNRVDSD